MISPSNVNRLVFVMPTNRDQCVVDTEQLHKFRKAPCFRQTFHINSEIIPTRCNNCVYSSQWLYSTCFGRQFHPSSGVQCCFVIPDGRIRLIQLSFDVLVLISQFCLLGVYELNICGYCATQYSAFRETARHNKTVLPTTQHDRQR